MKKPNRTCYLCGNEYYYCPSCPDDRRDPAIYVMWDSQKCKDIFNILCEESTGRMSTKDCKTKLIELGVKDMEIKNESVAKHIKRVMSYKDEKKVEVKATDDSKTTTKKTKTTKNSEAN